VHRKVTSRMRIAAIDLGSNSLHLLVVEARPDGTFQPLCQEKEMLRLGDVVSRTGRITPAALDDLLGTIRHFAALAAANGADEIVARATAALRDADNGAEVVDRVEAATGVRVEVISGVEEARLIFGAIRASVVIDPAPALCLDLGGGSLEIMVGDGEGLRWATSVRLGVARLTAELVSSDPPSGGDRRRLRQLVTSVLAPVVEEVAALGPAMLIGTSGTLCDLAAMASVAAGATLPTSLNHLTVTREQLDAVHEEVMRRPLASRRRLAGLDARRADLVPAGAVVLTTAMDLFGMDAMTVSDWALREGIVLDSIGQHDLADWTGDQAAIRRSSVLNLCRRCAWDERHGRQVALLSLSLFDQLAPVHHLARDDRELLEYGALLHDIGEHVAMEGHHKHTAYLIEHGRLRGFDPEEVAVLGCLGRFHRRGEPKPSFPPFASLDAGAQERVTRLVALLRLADGLDRSHLGTVRRVHVGLLEGGTVTIGIEADGDADLQLWGVRRKRDLFERIFEREIVAAEVPELPLLAVGDHG
jgi:exopolyphosphatase / guanosine-5'-triphosphate,3'-diphosphate pyrophosphatase